MTSVGRVFVVIALCLAPALGLSQELFSKLVGPVDVQPVRSSTPLEVPFITWGGDVATFHANGGLTTRKGTIYDRQGLNLKLTPGDDFIGQVKNYLGGNSPFLRGTLRMLGQASEVLGRDPRTKPVVVLQLSWSLGDHIVARAPLKKLNDLAPKQGKKVKIACQQGGPHVGLLYDALSQAKLKRDDIEIVWKSDLTGPNGPAEAFSKDKSIDACCVITPDMIGLTGGSDSVGSGAGGTVRGAHTLLSTAQMSRSIADVYAVRSDWFKSNRATVEKFVSGYLRGTEIVLQMRDNFEETQESEAMSSDYKALLVMAQSIFGKKVLPSIEVDAHGLLLDCSFARLPGQIEFFEIEGNSTGFEAKTTAALDLAVNWGYARAQKSFDLAGLDYKRVAGLTGLKYVRPQLGETFRSDVLGELLRRGSDDEDVIASFQILFDANAEDFPIDRYGDDFREAIASARKFGAAVMEIRGHADPTRTLVTLIRAGMARNLLKKVGSKWFFKGKEIDLGQTDNMVELIKSGAFDGVKDHDPRLVMQSALNLSLSRAAKVKDVMAKLAKKEGLVLDTTQLQPVGVGISEPVVPVPLSDKDAAPNRRVEFRIVKVPAEAIKQSDFDLLK